jgi:ABC-type branched-subunit amino acid transport system permease subunit
MNSAPDLSPFWLLLYFGAAISAVILMAHSPPAVIRRAILLVIVTIALGAVGFVSGSLVTFIFDDFHFDLKPEHRP